MFSSRCSRPLKYCHNSAFLDYIFHVISADNRLLEAFALSPYCVKDSNSQLIHLFDKFLSTSWQKWGLPRFPWSSRSTRWRNSISIGSTFTNNLNELFDWHTDQLGWYILVDGGCSSRGRRGHFRSCRALWTWPLYGLTFEPFLKGAKKYTYTVGLSICIHTVTTEN